MPMDGSIVAFLGVCCLYFPMAVAAAKSLPSSSSSSSLLFSGGLNNITSSMPDEQRLFYTLMTGYEKAVRPTRKSANPVVVKLGITLTQIMDIVSDIVPLR